MCASIYIWRSNEGERDIVEGGQVRGMSTEGENYS